MITEKMFSEPRLLVSEGKYVTDYWVINSNLDQLRAMAKMIKNWNEFGIFYEESKPSKGKDAEIIDMPKEQVDALPQAFRKKAVDIRKLYALQLKSYQQNLVVVDLVNKVVNAKTIDEAIQFRSPSGNTSAVRYIVDIYGGHEYTKWNIELIDSLTW